ncbi:hypothetical protein AGDE_05163 [Angomonas deanei]|nr:hypothetical protein AGDE_05163 [Angomonas deanei]|eukprot:EPY38766.1 hypothetical protein AGDE_05163 [Angomonas deanei]
MSFLGQSKGVRELEGIGITYDETGALFMSLNHNSSNHNSNVSPSLFTDTDTATQEAENQLLPPNRNANNNNINHNNTAGNSSSYDDGDNRISFREEEPTSAYTDVSCQPASPNYHARVNSFGVTFSGLPVDVVRFRSCINWNTRLYGDPNHNSTEEEQNNHNNNNSLTQYYGATAEQKTEDGVVVTDPPPPQTGPFSAELLSIILLYVDAEDPRSILRFGAVCRYWYYYSNYSPHWTFCRRLHWQREKRELPKSIRHIILRPKVVTREEFFREIKTVDSCKRVDRLLGKARHIRWCLALAIIVAILITANFVVAWFLGYLRTALRSDVNLAITTFVMMLVMVFLELTVIISPLGSMSAPSSQKEAALFTLSWALLMLVLSLLFGTITSLSFTRVQAEKRVLDAPTMNLTMKAPCTFNDITSKVPSFAVLPAVLSDIRWRPMNFTAVNATGDSSSMEDDDDDDTPYVTEVHYNDPTFAEAFPHIRPYCLQKQNDDSSQQCYVVLYFDYNYSSPLYRNETYWERHKNVGSANAFGFSPFSNEQPPEMWCSRPNRAPTIALSTTFYVDTVKERDGRFPTFDSWQSYAETHPSSNFNYSYRCSSSVNREKTESPPKSTEMWYKHSPAWTSHYVPLLSRTLGQRATHQRIHNHFFRYSYVCYIIAGIIWGVMLICQGIFAHQALTVLGITTVIAISILNPFTLFLSGILCVNVSDNYFMCSKDSGGAMIGGGLGIMLMALGIYVSVRQLKET